MLYCHYHLLHTVTDHCRTKEVKPTSSTNDNDSRMCVQKHLLCAHVFITCGLSLMYVGPTTHADLHCDRDFLPNGKITIIATLSLLNIPGLIEAIENFYVTPSLVDTRNQPAPPIQSYSSFNFNPDVSVVLDS